MRRRRHPELRGRARRWHGPVQELPVFDSRVRIDTKVKDHWGIPVLRLSGSRHPNDREVGRYIVGKVEEILKEMGATRTWRLLDDEAAARPAIPCIACHQFHAPGTIATRPDYAHPQSIAAERTPRAARLGFYYRYEELFFAADILPQLKLEHGGVPVSVAEDPRQRVCVQCHAPDSAHEAGTSDDRTPRGVHEGLSCLACHAAHSNDANASCATCHPALSNCGLDVTTMDTSFKDFASPNNIHTVDCAGCHNPAFLEQHRPGKGAAK